MSVKCTVRYTFYIHITIIFKISLKLIMIRHIHVAVIHTFYISVSSPDCLKLQFRHLRAEVHRGARGCSVLHNTTGPQRVGRK